MPAVIGARIDRHASPHRRGGDRARSSAGEVSAPPSSHAALPRGDRERDPELHAYLRTVEEPNGAGIPIALKDLISTQGRRDDRGLEDPRGLRARLRRHRRRARVGRRGCRCSARRTWTSSRWARPPRTRPTGRPATRGTSSASPAARPAARRRPSPAGSRRGRSAPTPAARSSSRPRSAASSACARRTARSRRYGIVAFASSLDQVGPITKTVRDCALPLPDRSPAATRATRRRSSCRRPSRSPRRDDLKGLRIGVPRELNEVEGIEPGVERRCRARDRALPSELGAEVGECEPAALGATTALPATTSSPRRRRPRTSPATTASATAPRGRRRRPRRALRAHAPRGLRRRAEAPHHARHLRALGRLLRRVLRAGAEGADGDRAASTRPLFERFDVLLSPTSPTVAFQLGERTAEPARDVPLRPAHDPVQHGRPARASRSRAASPRACPVGLQLLGPAVLGEPALPRRPRARAGARLRRRPGAPAMSWETVIGLEIHVQLKTRTKMFCRCETGFGEPQNTRTCPVCLAHPGALPGAEPRGDRVDDRSSASRSAARSPTARRLPPQELLLPRPAEGLPDLPVRRAALRRTGRFVVPGEDGDREVGIVRAHLEEDAAKTVHVGGARRPHRRRRPLARRLQPRRHAARRDRHAARPALGRRRASASSSCCARRSSSSGISDAEMEKGTLRVDANVSVRQAGRARLPDAQGAQEHELVQLRRARDRRRGARQIALYEAGQRGRPGDVRLRRRRRTR